MEHGKPVERLNSFSIPSTSLFWIRKTMAKILEEFDGSEILLKLPFNQFPFILEDKKGFFKFLLLRLDFLRTKFCPQGQYSPKSILRNIQTFH